MPSPRLQRAAQDPPAEGRIPHFASFSAPAPLGPAALAIALLAACLYAAFAHGAVASADEERLQLGLALIVLGAAAALSRARLAVTAPRTTWAALGLLAGFAVWSGVSVLWSVAPDRTWTETNRAITYALVLLAATAIGASLRRALTRVAEGLVLICSAVAVAGLAQKLVPGLHVAGLFDLDQTGALSRLQAPLGYWNALALVLAFGVTCALAVVSDRDRPDRVRLVAAAAATAMVVTIGSTYSRGGVLALVVALAVFVARAGDPLRRLLWLAVVVLGAAPVLIVGLNSHPLTDSGVALHTRETAGLELLVVLAACLALMLTAALRLVAVERRRELTSAEARRAGRALIGLPAVVVAVAVIAVAVSHRGLTGTVSHAWSEFTAARTTGVTDPSRLLSADSQNRWVWWQEAARAFAARPVQGWGAGSFPVVHLLYRRNTLTVLQPHSLPLQFLAETGLVGAALGLGALALLLVVGVRATRRWRGTRAGAPAAALLAVGVAYCVHALYDWDWDIPAVTLPALLALGVLGATAVATTTGSAAAATDGSSAATSSRGAPMPRAATIRALAAIACAALCLAAFAASVTVPRIAAADASRALVQASVGTPDALTRAMADARRATRLDPLSDAGLRAAAAIAIHHGDLEGARADLLAAVRREPSDEQAWDQLAITDLARGDHAESVAAARRAAAVDPQGPSARALRR